ncbi:hypothetical protein [Wukongibacter baidiensis]
MNEQLYKDLFEEGIFFTGVIDKKEDNEFNDVLAKYETKMKNGDIFDVKIIGASSNGDLNCVLDNGLQGVIENEDVEGKPYDPYTRSKYVSSVMRVAVKKVDREKNVIYFSRALAMDKVRNFLRADIIKKLKKAKKNNKDYPVVKAKVMFVAHNNRVYLNIAGVYLLGYVPIKNWKHGFIYNPKETIENNVIIDVMVVDYKPAINGKDEAFICSRKDLLPDPWEGIEERFKKNDLYEVTCVDRQNDKFYARMPGLEIDIFVQYPDNSKRDIPIVIETGKKYKIRIYKVSEEKRLLRARVIDEIRE